MDKYEYINELLKENNLSLLDLTKYYDSNKEIIDSFKSIFDEENLDAKYIINTIPVILNPDNAQKIQEFINEGEIPSVDYNQYKLQILTALLFNNEFFVYACNWCSYTLYQAEKNFQENKNVISFSWENLQKQKQLFFSQKIYYQAASKKGMQEIDVNPIVIEDLGVLRVLADVDNDNNKSDVQFYIKLNENQRNIQNIFKVTFIAKNDKKENSVILDKNNGIAILSEVIHNCDLSDGLEITQIEVL